MSLKLHLRGNTWHLIGTVRGERIRESTKTDNREKAEEIRVKYEAELLNRSIHGAKATATWLEAAEHYLQTDGDPTFLAPLNKALAATKLSEIDGRVLAKLRTELYPNLAPASVNRVLFTPVIAVMTRAAKAGLCNMPAIERPKFDNQRIRWLTEAEAERLIAACSPHLRVLVIFLFGTGARLSEALYLDWRFVDLERGQVTFIHAPDQGFRVKTKRSRGVPLPARVTAELRKLPQREGAVFLTDSGEPYARPTETRRGGGQIKTAFDGACRRAGITNFHPHDCRHTWATWLYQADPDPQRLMILGGWTSLAMVQRYAHVNVEGHADMVNAAFGTWGEAKPKLRVVS